MIGSPRRSARNSSARSGSPTSGRSLIRRMQTRVAVLMDVADMDAVMAAMETPAAGEAMASDGVVPESLVILVEA